MLTTEPQPVCVTLNITTCSLLLTLTAFPFFFSLPHFRCLFRSFQCLHLNWHFQLLFQCLSCNSAHTASPFMACTSTDTIKSFKCFNLNCYSRTNSSMKVFSCNFSAEASSFNQKLSYNVILWMIFFTVQAEAIDNNLLPHLPLIVSIDIVWVGDSFDFKCRSFTIPTSAATSKQWR